MKTSFKKLLAAVVAVVAMTATGCSLGSSSANFGNMNGEEPGVQQPNPNPSPEQPVPQPEQPAPTPEPTPEPTPPRCDMGKTYTGFAGTDLVAGRVDNDMGLERARVKPFTALQGEYPRVLGNTPGMLNDPSTPGTFAIIPNRWFAEPQGSAVTLYTSYRIAFQGCLTLTTTPAQYGSIPSNTTAETECTNWAKKFWSRDPSAAEVAACTKVAMVDSSKETNARRRWAYTCASVLTASDFLTY